jgi:septin 7
MEAEMKMVFQQKVQEKESKLKQSEEELYARHKEMKDALDKQRADLEDKKRRIESGRPLTPEKNTVSEVVYPGVITNWCFCRPRTVVSCDRFIFFYYISHVSLYRLRPF